MDFVKDNNPRHLKHAEDMLGEFPEYVKNAYNKNELEKLEHLDSSVFANPFKREFPLDTKENTFLSYAYYKSAGVQDKSVKENIMKAAVRHDVDISVLDQTYAVKEASDEEVAKSFALSINTGNETDDTKHYYPIQNNLAIEKSARDLAEDFHRVPLEAFRHAALNIVKAAKLHAVPVSSLPDRVRYTGAHREFNHKYAAQAVRQREKVLGNQAAEIYYEIVKSASVDVEHVNDYVDLFTDMDRMNNIKYSSHMLNPYEAFFSGHDIDTLEKTANAYVVVYDAPIPLEEFTKRAKREVGKNFTAEDSGKLMETVKIAEEQGGIAASGKIVEFPKELQRQFLETLIDVDMNNKEKYAMSKLANTAPLTNGTSKSVGEFFDPDAPKGWFDPVAPVLNDDGLPGTPVPDTTQNFMAGGELPPGTSLDLVRPGSDAGDVDWDYINSPEFQEKSDASQARDDYEGTLQGQMENSLLTAGVPGVSGAGLGALAGAVPDFNSTMAGALGGPAPVQDWNTSPSSTALLGGPAGNNAPGAPATVNTDQPPVLDGVGTPPPALNLPGGTPAPGGALGGPAAVGTPTEAAATTPITPDKPKTP